MRLQLADGYNKSSPVRVLSCPSTGSVVTLSNKANRKAKKAAKQQIKVANTGAKTKKKLAKVAKKEESAKRITQRATSKTKRQATGQQKRQTYREVGLKKQQNRMIRQTGRGNVIQQRQDNKLNKLKGSDSANYDEYESDSLPIDIEGMPGGGAMVDQEEYYPEDFENVYDSEEAQYEFLPEGYEENQLDPYAMEDGLVSSLIKGASKLVEKAGKTKVGGAVVKGAQSVAQFQRECNTAKAENVALKSKVSQLENQRLIYGGVGVLTGIVLGKILLK